MKVYTFANNAGRARTGLVNVNSLNVAPNTVIATVAGAVLPNYLLRDNDFFNVDQTGAATDLLDLPSAAAVGTIIHLYALQAIEVGAEGTDTINTVDGDFALVAGSLARCYKVADATWIVNTIAADGTLAAPIPS
jgi:hypothetical protein